MTVDAVTDLACMDGANMAAIALQLQYTARQAESRIYALEQRLRGADNLPTKVQRSTTNITGIVVDPFVGDQSIGPQNSAGTWVTDFDNTGVSQNVDSTALTMFGLLGEGLYEFGISCNLIASGAVTDNSYRVIRIVLYRQDPTAVDGIVAYEESGVTLYESNTGVGVDAVVTAEFRMEATDRVAFLVQHGNAGSSLNSTAGTLVWMTKKSSNNAVVVS